MTTPFGRSPLPTLYRALAIAALSVYTALLSGNHAWASLHEGKASEGFRIGGWSQLADSHAGGADANEPDTDYVRQLLQDPAAPEIGNPSGDVTVYEFFDYRCPYCKRVAGDVMRLVDDDPGVRIVFKEFPILGDESVTAARAALAAHKQGKYAAMHEVLMSYRGAFTLDALAELAAKAGVDAHLMLTEMSSPEILAQIQRNKDLATLLGIRGTPGFIFGRFLIPGAISYAEMRQLIQETRDGG